jgi:hypothetical protein
MDVAGFNDAWLADLGAKQPIKYGPRPAPAGPVPQGWGGASPAPVASPVPDSATGAPGATAEPSLGPSDADVDADGPAGRPILMFMAGLVALGLALLVVARTRGPTVGQRP